MYVRSIRGARETKNLPFSITVKFEAIPFHSLGIYIKRLVHNKFYVETSLEILTYAHPRLCKKVQLHYRSYVYVCYIRM